MLLAAAEGRLGLAARLASLIVDPRNPLFVTHGVADILHALDWLERPQLRRQATAELNKGESRNALARAVCFHRLGRLHDRTAQAQQHRASGLAPAKDDRNPYRLQVEQCLKQDAVPHGRRVRQLARGEVPCALTLERCTAGPASDAGWGRGGAA